MWYAFVSTDHPESLAGRKSARPAHIARLKQLQDEGRLLLAGPFPAIDSPEPGPAGFSGSLIVAEFASLAEAQSWAATDPSRPNRHLAAEVRVDGRISSISAPEN